MHNFRLRLSTKQVYYCLPRQAAIVRLLYPPLQVLYSSRNSGFATAVSSFTHGRVKE